MRLTAVVFSMKVKRLLNHSTVLSRYLATSRAGYFFFQCASYEDGFRHQAPGPISTLALSMV